MKRKESKEGATNVPLLFFGMFFRRKKKTLNLEARSRDNSRMTQLSYYC